MSCDQEVEDLRKKYKNKVILYEGDYLIIEDLWRHNSNSISIRTRPIAGGDETVLRLNYILEHGMVEMDEFKCLKLRIEALEEQVTWIAEDLRNVGK